MSAWTEVNPTSKPKEGIRNIKFAATPTGGEITYEVRFIGEPITFYKYFINSKSAITEDPTKCIIKKKHNVEPQTKHAVNLILRNDVAGYKGGLLYLAEVSPPVLTPVKAWAIRRKMDPGGKVAVDFSITVRGTKLKTRYEVVALDTSTLTPEEEALQLYELNKLFKPTPQDQIEARLGYNADSSVGTTVAAPKTATQSAAKPIAQDLPF